VQSLDVHVYVDPDAHLVTIYVDGGRKILEILGEFGFFSWKRFLRAIKSVYY